MSIHSHVLPTCLVLLASCSGTSAPSDSRENLAKEKISMREEDKQKTELATFGAGCYWCVEAVLERLEGVLDVRSGFMGGKVPNPSYQAVCSGTTGHAEVVQVEFDPERISYEDLLGYFWALHDPTTLNRQGADVGTQYRSAIFYHGDEQKRAAEASRKELDAKGSFKSPIVTEITPASKFYEADESHQDFYRLNRSNGYCRAVIAPKLEKLGLEE